MERLKYLEIGIIKNGDYLKYLKIGIFGILSDSMFERSRTAVILDAIVQKKIAKAI